MTTTTKKTTTTTTIKHDTFKRVSTANHMIASFIGDGLRDQRVPTVLSDSYAPLGIFPILTSLSKASRRRNKNPSGKLHRKL